MPMPKRKPNYNGATTMQELLTAVCDYYGDHVDDRETEDPDHISLHDVADRFDITVMKARKLLITGGLYSTTISRRVQELHAQGLTVAQITEETGLKRASIKFVRFQHIGNRKFQDIGKSLCQHIGKTSRYNRHEGGVENAMEGDRRDEGKASIHRRDAETNKAISGAVPGLWYQRENRVQVAKEIL